MFKNAKKEKNTANTAQIDSENLRTVKLVKWHNIKAEKSRYYKLVCVSNIAHRKFKVYQRSIPSRICRLCSQKQNTHVIENIKSNRLTTEKN